MNCFFLLFFLKKPVALIKTKIVPSQEQNAALGNVGLNNLYDSHSIQWTREYCVANKHDRYTCNCQHITRSMLTRDAFQLWQRYISTTYNSTPPSRGLDNPRVCSQSVSLLRDFLYLSSHNWTSKNLLVKSFKTSHHLYIWNLTQAFEHVS